PLHPVKDKNSEKLERLLKILDERPNSASLHAKAATEYLAAGRYRDATKEFQDSYRIDQTRTDAIAGLQDIANDINDVGSSLQLAKQAAQIRPNDAGIQNRLGSSYARAGRFQEAIDAFDRALKLEPGSVV